MKSNNTFTVLVHEHPEYAYDAANIMAEEWKHQMDTVSRNVENMKVVPIADFPCHLALLLKLDDVCKVIGHVKLSRADGRSDGPCCIVYSLVIDLAHRGQGFGRVFMERIEEFVADKGISYIYLSTPDKAAFYKHLGYKESDEVSSLGESAKHLKSHQIAKLEGLFAKRLDIAPITPANTWLKKRLVFESDHFVFKDTPSVAKDLLSKLSLLSEFTNDTGVCTHYVYIINIPYKQQVGPSCGVVVMSMALENFKECTQNNNDRIPKCATCSSDVIDTSDVVRETCKSAVEFSIKSGISYDGELFCAYNFSYLAQEYWHKKLAVKDISETTFKDIIVSLLLKSLPVFVAYDRSLSDHTPAMHDGKHAHWAVIHGVISTKMLHTITTVQPFNSSNQHTELFTYEMGSKQACMESIVEVSEEDVFLVCSHAMSEKSFITTFAQLTSSNQQLNTCKSNIYLASQSLSHLRNKIVFICT